MSVGLELRYKTLHKTMIGDGNNGCSDAIHGAEYRVGRLTAAMILLMEGGFALLEAGFVRQKNAVSIIMKVFVDITFGALVFYFVGFALMYGKDAGG